MASYRLSGLALVLGAALAVPAFAQSTNITNAPASSPNVGTHAAVSPRSGPNGTLQKTHGDWRSGQLNGATVYNDSGDSIGTIDSLLVTTDGKIDKVVISVGGFLGMGSKLVAVPFNQIKFERSQQGRGVVPPLAERTNAAAGSNGSVKATNAPANNPASVPAIAGPSTLSRPDYYSVVLPNATKKSLTSMQAFTYGG